jgi:Mo-dependent nitrogenase C-terminus
MEQVMQGHLRQPSESFDILNTARCWLNSISIHDKQVAHRVCKTIPAQCPFERDLKFLSYKIIHIPPLCKLNPLFEELVALRFRALCYLADECGEDVSQYC